MTRAGKVRTAFVVVLAALMTIVAGTLTPRALAAVPAFSSDDFSAAALDAARWTTVDPVGDGSVSVTGSGTAESQLRLSVPAGVAHDAWNNNRSLRIMQATDDVDLQAAVRFTTVPTRKYQMQGVLIEQDASNWLRFDVHSTGSALRLFAAKTVAGVSSSLGITNVSVGTEVGLRLTRTGSTWALEYSSDGTAYPKSLTVQHALTASRIGLFAGNSGDNPAWTSDADFFFDTTGPIDPEDGPAAATFGLTTSVIGSGSITRDPAADSYPAGTVVTLRAAPALNHHFVGWSGDAAGTQATTTVTMSAARSVTATFQADTPPPATYPLEVTVVGSGAVTRTPEAASYPAGAEVTLEARPPAGWAFSAWSGDASGSLNPVVVVMDAPRSVTATFTQVASGSSAFRSDDFSSGSLDPAIWTVSDPQGDGAVAFPGAGTSDARVSLSVPTGPSHDAYNVNRSLRATQPLADVDFEAELRFLTVPSRKSQQQGLLVEQDALNWLRFDVHHTGNALRVYAARTVEGSSRSLLVKSIPPAVQMHLRVGRTADTWTLSWSADAITWTVAGTFSHVLAATRIGPFAGNDGRSAWTADIDWVFDRAAPVDPEDGTVSESHPLTTDVVGSGTVLRSPNAAAYPAGTVVSLTAQPTAGWRFDGWSRDVVSTAPTVEVAMDAARSILATFSRAESTAPQIDIWYGESQVFGGRGRPQRWANVLGRASDADGVATLTYRLNGGTSTAVAMGPDRRRLFGPGDYNVQLDLDLLLDGANSVEITATDALGTVTSRLVTVYKNLQSALLPHLVDWQSGTDPNALAQVVDGKWGVDPGGLTIHELGYDRTVAVGDIGWSDYVVTVPVTVRRLGPDAGTPESGDPLVGLGLRWSGHTQRISENPYTYWFPTGAFAWHRWTGSGRWELQGNGGSPLVRTDVIWDFGVEHVLKVRVETVASGTRYSSKIWPATAPEPATWALSIVEDAGPAAGSVLLIAHHVDATFGDVRVDAL